MAAKKKKTLKAAAKDAGLAAKVANLERYAMEEATWSHSVTNAMQMLDWSFLVNFLKANGMPPGGSTPPQPPDYP